MAADIIQKTCVIGCIDRSSSAIAVCHASAWIAQTLNLPLTLLHMNEKIPTSAHHDLSGIIGFDTRETLLNELVDIEEKRARLTREEGRQLLMSAKKITQDLGLHDVNTLQRQGSLAEMLNQEDAHIVVLGRRGEQSELTGHIGSQLEGIIRLQKNSVLICKRNFAPPKKIMIAFDGSEEGERVIHRLIQVKLLAGRDCHLAMHGSQDSQLKKAQDMLHQAGIEVKANLLQGGDSTVDELCGFAVQNHIDLIIMGAFGHSRLRQFFAGSHTTEMIAKTPVSLLIIR
ncbi:universal stress protein [Providencia vermicola]|uniref:Universal stress protein n=2 Tax=Morganellaceae TaxID=1903414 RepID=A0AAI9MUD6_MORMO|nr:MULTISPECIES: universal stress protein [Morganellaceae]EKW8762755.1 universal stress protein [Morganella morganii]HEJ9425170.1 universal stress protein [Proteus mirabilis]UAX03677.1 universal stress protein [Proteus terrae subsp. cibarius]UPS61078.1 universal stress protein [Providencia rettgeri]HEC8328849.1 universal stress protein [Providencia rettgeri]